MKKIVSVFALGIAFMAGTSIQAQDKHREAAKEQVTKLDEILDLDDKQEEAVYRVYVAYEINSAPEKASAGKKTDPRADMIKNEMSLMKTMKNTLSPEQFEKYQSYRMENMTKEEREVMEIIQKKSDKNTRVEANSVKK